MSANNIIVVSATGKQIIFHYCFSIENKKWFFDINFPNYFISYSLGNDGPLYGTLNNPADQVYSFYFNPINQL